jgi:hypothetical protein
MSTTATLAEPRVGPGSSANETPGNADVSRGSVSPEVPAPETETSEKVADGSRILESLSPAALKKWKLTGLLPPDVELKEPRKRSVGENEETLSKLTSEERDQWRATGNLPKEKAGESSAKGEAGAAKGGEAGDEELSKLSESSPLAKIHSLTAKGENGQLAVRKGKEAEADSLHSKATSSLEARMAEDRKSFSAADQVAIFEHYNKEIGPLLPESFVTYLRTGIQPHLNAPFKFFREFTMNEAFRQEVLRAGFGEGGNLDKMVKVIAKFDAQHAPTPVKRVSSAPAPAASVAGKATAAVDAEGAAVRDGNFRSYMAEANRSEWARRRR